MRVKYMQDASEQDVIWQETMEKVEIENEIPSVAEESDSSESSEKLYTKALQERREEVEKEEQRNVPSHEESVKEDTSDLELATITRSASSTAPDDGTSVVPVSGVAVNEMKRQMETDEFKAGVLTTGDKDGRQSSNHVAVGEWNSLPILVERLREALELSLAAGCWRGDEPTATSSLAESGVGNELNDRFQVHRSMEQAMFRGDDNSEAKKDELKFLEDLLLSDIQTALSRLRETLERTDVTTLAKHGGVSDPTSKLHLLRLVSSLLSRLQVPQKELIVNSENRLINVITAQGGTLAARKRRSIRHTIGVSAEEIAYARKQLEESSAGLMKLNNVSIQRQQESLIIPSNAPNSAPSNTSSDTPNSERHTEEICDKYTKDAINQRQSLRDKNKDWRENICAYRLVTTGSDESNMSQDQHWYNNIDDQEAKIERINEEQSRVTKLAAVLRQRAELVSASRCNVNNNKFITKKSKIKRANTVDIPSYLKLQAGSSSCDSSGCMQLRRPIHVGDKVALNATNNVAVPSFHPRTENDKKFLALINRNNEMQTTLNVASAFKSFGYTKATDTSSLTNENWNSRFSNIKTAFDKPSSVNDENKLSPKPRPVKHFPSALQTSSQLTNKRTPIKTGSSSNGLAFVNTNVSKPDKGFKHAPSSLFRKIEKPQNPISSSNYHWFKDNVSPPGNSLREKARIMFDRGSNVQSQSTSKLSINAHENFQKSSFPRPPWIERDRNEGKSSGMIAENGRLDYRLFCKQFAPFIGKNTVTELKISRNHEEYKHNEHSIQREVILPSDGKFTITNGKTSFETFSEKKSRIQQHRRSNESRREIEGSSHDKSNHSREKDVFEQIHNCRCNEQNLPENAVIDATLNGSSSIAIQTGEDNDYQPEEVRVFRVVPRVTRGRMSICNDAFVQTYNQSEQPLTKYIESQTESKKEQETSRYKDNDVNSILNSNFHSAEDSRSFTFNHNWNYHTLIDDVASKNESSMSENTRDLVKKQSSVCLPNPIESIPYRDISDYYSPEQRERASQIDNCRYENRFLSKLASDNKSQIYQNYLPDIKSNRDSFESEISNVSHEIDKNDLLCVNDGGLPEEQNIQNQDISTDAGVVTRYTCAIATVASADTLKVQSEELGPEFIISSSPSPSHFRSYAEEASNEIRTTEEEIRRHNMLQQSLVHRLQNERTILNDKSVHKQPSSLNQSTKFQSFNTPKLEPPLITGFLSIPSSSGFSTSDTTINRVSTLREQYEQPGGQPRPVQKERSTVLNSVSGAMNSGDKYLMSCSNKSVKSAVLSKSESWHQLALSNSHHPPPRPSQARLSPTSHLPKLPKSKSPSFFRMKKQYEASLSSDNVRKMEDKIRRYFDNSNDNVDAKERFSSHDIVTKGLVGLSRSRTMPGICNEKLHLLIPAVPQIPTTNLNSADVDKVFDDIFEEATRTDDHRF